MKATGMVRRIDELGRIVIPKEIRRTQHIRQGMSLEIYTAADGKVIFKKYSPIGELGMTAQEYTAALAKVLGKTAVICDRESVIAVSGQRKKAIAGKEIGKNVDEWMEKRHFYPAAKDKQLFLSGEEKVGAAAPIIVNGDVVGGVFTLSEGCEPAEEKAVQIAAAFLASHLEE